MHAVCQILPYSFTCPFCSGFNGLIDFFRRRDHAADAFAQRYRYAAFRSKLHVFDHLATLRPDPTKDRKEEAVRLTRETMALLDAAIQKTPEHWFWYNKRWLLQPV